MEKKPLYWMLCRQARWVMLGVSMTVVFPVLGNEPGQLKDVQQALKSVEKQIKLDAGTRQKSQKSLEKIEREIASRRQRQRQTTSRQAALQSDIDALNVQRAHAAQSYRKQQSELKEWLRLSYQLSRQNRMKWALSERDPARIARANQYYAYLARAQEEKLSALSEVQQQLAKVETQLDKEQATQRALADRLEKDQAYLTQLKKNRETTITKLNQSISSAEQTASELKAREKRLKAVLAKIAKRQARKKRAQEKARRAAAQKQQKNRRPEPAAIQARATGSLPMPVKAPLLTRFGQKRPGSDVGWTGVMLGAKAGSQVKAIRDGEVVYADWLNGYGQLLIIDHGDELMSLYGHNALLLKREGDHVTQQETIAQVGDTAGLSKAALYFEVRHRGQPQDPLKWCRG